MELEYKGKKYDNVYKMSKDLNINRKMINLYISNQEEKGLSLTEQLDAYFERKDFEERFVRRINKHYDESFEKNRRSFGIPKKQKI